jgi:hypothetical protein
VGLEPVRSGARTVILPFASKFKQPSEFSSRPAASGSTQRPRRRHIWRTPRRRRGLLRPASALLDMGVRGPQLIEGALSQGAVASGGSTRKHTWDAEAGESVETITRACADGGSSRPTTPEARRMAASTSARRARGSSSRPPMW